MDRRYHYLIGHGEKVQMTASLNDVPFYRSVPSSRPTTRSGLANHLLKPGTNTFRLEIEQSSPGAAIAFSLTADDDRDRSVHRCVWPNLWQNVARSEWKIPYTHEATFEVTGTTLEPVYLEAAEGAFGPAGNDALHEAVTRFQSVLAQRDSAGVVREGALKIAEYRKFYPEESEFSADGTKSKFDRFFSAGTWTPPFDAKSLQYRSCSNGRVAHVTGRGGHDAIEVRRQGGGALTRDLWMTNVGGRWQLFR
jgi:hypothetical protein